MNLLNCNQISELLSAYIENELDVTTSLQVANHLERCSNCEKEFSYLTRISSLVKTTVRQLDERDPSIEIRTKNINQKVKQQIISTLSKENAVDKSSFPANKEFLQVNSSTNVLSLASRIKKLSLKSKIFLSIAATLVIGFLSVFSVTYYATATGPLLTGVVRNHQFCSAIEMSNIGLHKGYQTEQLLEVYNTKLPNLENLGIKFLDLHPCEVYKTPFLHLMYNKSDKPISIYYGSKEAVSKFKEVYPNAVLGQLYLQESSNLQIGAISVSSDNVWLIAGQLTKEEVNMVSKQLVVDSFQIEQSQLFANLLPFKIIETDK